MAEKLKLTRAERKIARSKVAVHNTLYEVSAIPRDDEMFRHMSLRVEYRGRDRWVVLDSMRRAYTRTGGRSWESQPSSRTQGWMKTHYFDLPTALEIAQRYCIEQTCMGWTVATWLERIEAGKKEENDAEAGEA